MVVIALCVSVTSVWHAHNILQPVLSDRELYSVALSFMVLIVSTEFGLFGFSMLVSEYRRKKIQRDLDIERSFRKLGGDL